MELPDYQTLMIHCLKSVATRDFSTIYDVLNDICKTFELSEEQVNQLLPSGTEPVIKNRVSWAMFYLLKATLLQRPQRGKYSLTNEGQKVVKAGPAKIDNAFLKQYETFRNFIESSQKSRGKKTSEAAIIEAQNPREGFERSYVSYKSTICAEILSTIRTIEPRQFEILVLELLKKMNYGTQSISSSIKHTGKSGDGGIDGEIYQDALGLDRIFVQAKRYAADSGVGREDLQKFVGSLNERKSKKGILSFPHTLQTQQKIMYKELMWPSL